MVNRSVEVSREVQEIEGTEILQYHLLLVFSGICIYGSDTRKEEKGNGLSDIIYSVTTKPLTRLLQLGYSNVHRIGLQAP